MYYTLDTNRLECACNVIEQLRLTLNRTGFFVSSKNTRTREIARIEIGRIHIVHEAVVSFRIFLCIFIEQYTFTSVIKE